MTQQEAFDILTTGQNVFITGAAGSGKTHLLNRYIDFLKARKIGVGVTASTGIAATHLGGVTIHSWAGIGIANTATEDDINTFVNQRVRKRFLQARALIIDEISMLDADRLDLVERVARQARGSWEPFGGLQLVLCGDFFQLPPVAAEGKPPPRFAYQAAAWARAKIRVCYLGERHRQEDAEFLEVLDDIRSASVSEKTIARLEGRRNAELSSNNATKLYSHNVDVDAENAKELARLPAAEKRYRMALQGVPAVADALRRGCLAPETLVLKKGAAVMFVKNNFERGYVNGTLGTVTDFDNAGYPVVKTFNGGIVSAEPATWSIEDGGKTLAELTQVPLRLAWAMTVHKSQGMTLDAVHIDLSGAFEPGMGYVALSRARTLGGIRLLGLNDTALKVHPDILEFDKQLQADSKNTRREFLFLSDGAKEIARRKFSGGASERKQPKTYSVGELSKRHPAAYQKWSSEEEERLADAFRRGTAIRDLAKMFGRKSGGIRARLKRLNLVV